MKSFANTFLYIRLIIDLNYNTKTKLCHNNKKNYNNKSPTEAGSNWSKNLLLNRNNEKNNVLKIELL